LEAGEDVLSSQGLNAARMEEVAQKARVAVGTIYNLIGDRDALVVEIMKVRHEQVVTLLTKTLTVSEGKPFRQQGLAFLAALHGYFLEHRRFFRMAQESERGPACAHKRLSQETLGRIRDAFRELVQRGIDQGVLRSAARDLSTAALMGMTREVLMLDIETQHPSTPEARMGEVLSIFIDGTGVR
jgi:AcrR family transcriptional regulator